MSLRQDFFQPRVGRPPTTGNADLDRWLADVALALNDLPPISVFSHPTPNSNISAQRGTLGLNLASNTTVWWLKESGTGNTGWSSVATDRAYP